MRYFLTFAEIASAPTVDTALMHTPEMVKSSRNTPPASFESALDELEGIVRSMETQPLPLEESLAAYERGVALLKYCQEALGAAEQKLQILESGGLREFAPTSVPSP